MNQTVKKKGRPLSFDRDEALQKVMLLFWQHGYEATSLNDITSALEVKPSSIYSAFGDKKKLFLDAVGLYLSGPITSETIIEQAVSAYDAAQELLRVSAIGFTGTTTPPGCLLASSAISCSDAANDVKLELAAIRRQVEERLRTKILQSIDQKQLPVNTDADGLAAMTMAVIQGMSTLARDGATREKLLHIGEMAMRVWPKFGST
ncbi:TetR/AcrR family transcriptional regulator [Undibacterium sp. 5I1]|uniref:TetR/AcrR family transcriptional regulator n=1 Tax=unclassified Undibacterium TaxID=2630295 RepID=UPI002AB4E172|nr:MULTISPECIES: TetR/AcrR family transcriptional regulator [unclassified Undibacterium]MDY7539599.1 TetR/AcrR family transcriptional regulator [Undibacterium sp. 5I1]MEB0230450.1 TetR/AcrR family transcriptional regulator [Undibacterium sp. 10I3]MEB0258488.1 TetR/AcrR family transcriptional regulator [Undibacterium sp. 5I1]